MWYLQPIIEETFLVKVGRIGVIGSANIVSGDSDTQFINPLFTSERSNWKPYEGDNADAWGFSFMFFPSELVEIIYGYAGPNGKTDDTTITVYQKFPLTIGEGSPPDEHQTVTIPIEQTVKGKTYHFDSDGYNAIEINLKFIENANYRLKFWQLNEVKVEGKTSPSGFSISFDQEITQGIQIGGRYGKVDSADSLPETSINNLSVKEAYSLAFQVSGSYWQRDLDTAGIAIGRESYHTFSLSPKATISEIYYRYVLNDYIAISPAIQYQVYSDMEGLKDQFAYAIRARFSF
jgi:hypothetical protein